MLSPILVCISFFTHVFATPYIFKKRDKNNGANTRKKCVKYDLSYHISVPFLQHSGLGSSELVSVNSDDTFVNPVNSVATNYYDEAFPNLLQVIT